MKLPTEDPIIRAGEFASAMSCSRATLYRRIQAGIVPKPMRYNHILGWRRSEAERVIRELFEPREWPGNDQARNGLGQFMRGYEP